ncbi:Cytochrome c4 [hydrothermal vent metagenome]|uniref:Cytochrome c4 n=1 Tax=hydrothermal vent metagenome TaxID=652676 RepID=A0A3B1AQR7_9ZZZZ
MRKSFVAILALVGLSIGVCVQAAGDAAVGQARAATCLACHGPGGNSLNPMWPKLSGQHPAYMKTQIDAFKAGVRKDPIMAPMAMTLDDKSIADLGAYFASVKRTAGIADPKKAAQGRKIYMQGNPAKGLIACSTCHGIDGYGNPSAGFPNIASQQAMYMVKTLKEYRTKTRTTDPGRIMQDAASRMTDTEIDLVTQFVTGMKP